MRIKLRIISALLLTVLFSAAYVFSQEEIEYKKFKLEDASCDVGVRYKSTEKGLIVGVSAIATGKGSEFRKWDISDIKMRIGNDRLKPDEESKFYVSEESFFRIPGAVIFAAIGAFGEYGGSNLNNNLSKVGVALGLGLIALQAKGEITGRRAIFYIPGDIVTKIDEGKDMIEILLENENKHVKDEIKIGLIKPGVSVLRKYDFKDTGEEDLSKMTELLKKEIVLLEQEQSAYKYGVDPEYDSLQRKIENLEAQRGLAYNELLERRDGQSTL